MGFRAFGIVTSLLVIIISTDICFAASSNPFMSKPLITSGSVITEGDPITISASLNGEFAVSDLNSVLIYVSSILLQNRMITLTFDILVYEDGLGPDLTDTKLLETSFIHKARFSNIPKQNGVSVELSENQIKKNVFDANELINLMKNLNNIPLGTIPSSKKIYAKVRARCNLEGIWNFDPLGFGYQKETSWSRSDTVSVNVVEKPKLKVDFNFKPDSETINLGESITISAECENLGGKGSDYSTISISFPDLNNSGDENQVSLYDHNFYGPRCYTSIIPRGGTIWKLIEGPTMEKSSADYVLVEGGTSEKVNWEAKEKHYLKVTVTPKKTGEFNIFVRATFPSLAKKQMFTDPSSANYDKDQQNFGVYRKKIIVKEPSELEVRPSNYDIDFGNINVGEDYSTKISITNSGGETLNWQIKDKKTLTGGVKEGINWASFEPSSGTLGKGKTSEVIIKLDTTNSEIKPGHKYDATFLISSNSGESNHQIHFYVNKPELQIDNSQLDFGKLDQGKSISKAFSISNKGEGKLKWNIDPAQLPNWIKLDKYSGEVQAGSQPGQISATLDTQGLAPDNTYENKITISSNGGTNEVNINVEVLRPPVLCTSPDPLVLDFGKVAQRRTETRTIELSNCGGSTLSWSATSDSPSWLTVNPDSGSTSTESNQVTVTVNTESMEPETYIGQIKIDSNGGSKTCIVNIEVINPEAIVVCPEGCTYKSIQEAIDAAKPEDVIEVHSGTYLETVNVNKRLSLRGIDTGEGKPIINANGNGNAITISADGAKIEGFKIIGSAEEIPAGIYITSSNNLISGNEVVDNRGWGIYIERSENNIVKQNDVRNNKGEGIGLRDSDKNIISDNIVSKNLKGVSLQNSKDNQIYGNKLIDNILNNAYDDGSNQWDNGKAGNTYSDLECTDENGDDICDSSYIIPGGSSVDQFPYKYKVDIEIPSEDVISSKEEDTAANLPDTNNLVVIRL